MIGTRGKLYAVAAAAISTAACGGSMQSGGFTVDADYTKVAFEKVKNRASFELECQRDKIDVVVLNTRGSAMGGGTLPTQIGATGCGKKVVYIPTPEQEWIMNAGSERK